MKFDCNVRSLTNIRIVSVYGDCQYIIEIALFIFITRIGNLLINSLYGVTETSASWFEMAFKRWMLGVTFHVNGLDLIYANIWQTSFTDIYIKQWLRRFPKERFVCKYDRELACDWMILMAFGLATMHSL